MERTNMERFMHNYISGNYINNKVNDEINNMYKNFLQSAKKIDNKKCLSSGLGIFYLLFYVDHVIILFVRGPL